MSLQNSPQDPLNLSSGGLLVLIEDLLKSGFSVRIKVGGHSMQPFLMENDIVTIQEIRTTRIKRGDIILFVNEEGRPLLHRVVRINREAGNKVAIQTKGDGSTSLDTPVDTTRILGYATRIEVRKPVSAGKETFLCTDLTGFRQKLIASVIAWRELFGYYLSRIKVKSGFSS